MCAWCFFICPYIHECVTICVQLFDVFFHIFFFFEFKRLACWIAQLSIIFIHAMNILYLYVHSCVIWNQKKFEILKCAISKWAAAAQEKQFICIFLDYATLQKKSKKNEFMCVRACVYLKGREVKYSNSTANEKTRVNYQRSAFSEHEDYRKAGKKMCSLIFS